MALLIHSQIFIAFSVSLLLLNWILKAPSEQQGRAGKNMKVILITTSFFIIFYFLFKLPAFLNDNYWTQPLSSNFHYNGIIPFILEIPRVIMGYFYYEMTFPMRIRTLCFGIGYFFLFGMLLTTSFIKGDASLRLNIVLIFAGGIFSFFAIMFMKIASYRYFLGFETAILFAFIIALLELFQQKTMWKLFLILLVPFSIGISITSKHVKDSWMLPERNDLKLYTELTNELYKRKIMNVFCTDPLLQWMLNYNGYNARFTSKNERINRFGDEVNKCYINPDCKTGIVGYKGMCLEMDQIEGWHDKVVYINDKFFLLENPKQRYLDKGGFEFPK